MDKDFPVVLINGLIGCLDYPFLHDALVPRSVIAPDLLGYGRLDAVEADEIDIAAQVEHLHRTLQDCSPGQRVHLIGHSVGGVVAVEFARRYPLCVASIVSIEGNFTLNDAFWSSSVAQMTVEHAESMLTGFRADTGGWLARSGIEVNSQRLATATAWLNYQPAGTLQAMARSVVQVTSDPGYLPGLKALFSSVRIHLVAGERSLANWDVPQWARQLATSMTVLPGVGHLMMLEGPEGFAREMARIINSAK
ncbi:alpha/beta fold hydrolase [Pseudomonas sp.]|uniref:alpha/beta fold hydrolase n=1 Tax=Pseudomonas sp. TaxID=306 RepID=UPI003D6F7ED9